MRNRYRAAWRTYHRPMFLTVLIAAAAWIVMLGMMIFLSRVLHQVPNAPEPVQNRMREDLAPLVAEVQHTVVTGFIGMQSLILLMFVGVGLSIHLKELLGSPTSRVVPGLRRTHLTVAAVIVAVFIGALALAICCGPGLGISPLAVVACLLAMLAIPAFLAHWRPEALLLMIVVLPLPIVANNRRPLEWPPSELVFFIVLAVSIGCLASVGMRLGRFNEEMREYRLRIQTGIAPGATHVRVLWPAPLGDIRYWRRVGARAPASLLWRARHWHAAWGTLWLAPISGVFMGVLTGIVAFKLRHFSVPELIGSPNLAYLAVMAVAGFLGPYRSYLTQELMRPQTRAEHVRTVGVTLAAATFVSWSSMLAGAFATCWIVDHNGPPIEQLWRPAVFSFCCLLMFYGIATWPFRAAVVYLGYFALFGVMGSFALTPMQLSGSAFAIASAALALAGVILTRRSYLRWLNDEVDSDSAAWKSTWARGWRWPRDARGSTQ